MKKASPRKPSAVLPLPEKEKGKAGRITQSTRKPASTQGERSEGSQSVKGYENIGGKQIPFVRNGSGEYIVTTYGSQDATDHVKGTTLLVKHERRGAVSWGGVAAGSVLMKGPVTNKLQGLLSSTAGNNLYVAVRAVYMDPNNESVAQFAAQEIFSFIRRDILGGHTRHCDILAKCIEAAPERDKQTKREKLYNALIDAANQLKRIPIKSEVQEKWDNGESDARDVRNFEKELKGMGLDWLPSSL